MRRSDPPDSNWIFVGSDRRKGDIEIPPEAFAAAPPEVARGGVVLPRPRLENRCQLCGTVASLTREHIPPASAGNRGRSTAHTIDEWFQRTSLDEIPGGRVTQGGIWGRTLCEPCNNSTGRYADEYRGWAARAARIMREDLPPPRDLDRKTKSTVCQLEFHKVRPGAFVRQVLSLMASLSGPWDLAGRHPELRAIVLDGTCGRLPVGMTISMALFHGPGALMAGPFMVVDRDTTEWKWSLVVAFPPFAFEMVLASSGAVDNPLCTINDFLDLDPGVRGDIELDLLIAFGHTALPTDWRTRAQIEQGLTLYGQPETG